MENNGNRMNVLEDLINEFELNQSLTQLNTDLEYFGQIIDVSNTIAQTTGYTPTCDGFLYIIMNPGSVNSAYVCVSSSDSNGYAGVWLSVTSNTGTATTGMAPAFKGVNYKRTADVNNTAKILFIPKSK